MVSPTFLFCLIVIALVWTGLGALSLVLLLLRDWKAKQLW